MTTWGDLTKELQHALLATSRDEEIKFVEAEYLYDNGLIAYKPPTMIGVSRYRLTPAGRALLPAPTLTGKCIDCGEEATRTWYEAPICKACYEKQLPPQALDADSLATDLPTQVKYWQAMNEASLEAHTETLEKLAELEKENALLLQSLANRDADVMRLEAERDALQGQVLRLEGVVENRELIIKNHWKAYTREVKRCSHLRIAALDVYDTCFEKDDQKQVRHLRRVLKVLGSKPYRSPNGE